MVVGFNHNIMYRGEIFHIQTEDSGISNPHIITHLYRGGSIIASKKTSYADIIKVEHLEKVVEELMKEQHKEVLRRLKAGEFDARAFDFPPAVPSPPSPGKLPSDSPTAPVTPPETSSVASKPEQGLDKRAPDRHADGEA